MLHNEMMGFYRKQGLRDEAIAHAEAALNLIRKLGMDNTVTAGTTWVNAGTVREAFGDPAGGIACFEKARENYEKKICHIHSNNVYVASRMCKKRRKRTTGSQ